MRRELTFEAKGKVLTCCQLFSMCAMDCCQCLLYDALQHLLAVTATLRNTHFDCLSSEDGRWARPLPSAPEAARCLWQQLSHPRQDAGYTRLCVQSKQ